MLETQDLRDFSIINWYEIFKNITLHTIIISLPDELIEKFKSDDTDIEIMQSCSQEITTQLKNALNVFKATGAFIKNNWHAPIDAKFISFGNCLNVSCVNDVFLYLSASDIISSDFARKHDSFCIAFRPWLNIHPASEFRCIVVNNVLRGITPRDWPTFYAHFKDEGPEIIKTISQFYNANIKDKFCRANFIFDVILNYPESIKLVDFGPLNNKTNLYAFSWKEVHEIVKKNCTNEVAPVFRYLETDMGIMTKAEALMKIARSEESNESR